jgi:uncharacterized protein DUF5317
MLWLGAIVLGVAFGLLTGGKITNLGKVRFRWPWVVLGVILVRFLVLATPLNAVERAQYLYVLALAVIVGWTALHYKRVRGIWLISIGALLNLIVILANGGRMPVAPELARSMGGRATVGQYTVMGSQTNLNFLGDWIRLGPSPEAYSLGDVLIGVGLAIVVFLAIRNPSAYEGVSPP